MKLKEHIENFDESLLDEKVNNHFGLFGEARYLSYFGIDSYSIKAGLNYTFF